MIYEAGVTYTSVVVIQLVSLVNNRLLKVAGMET